MGIRTQNIELGAVADQILGGASNASTFGDYPTTPVTYLPPSCKRTHIFEKFSSPIQCSLSHDAAGGATGMGGAATGDAGDVNFLFTRFNAFEYHVLGTQTITVPKWAATGLDIGMDQTDNDGVELTLGCEDNAASGTLTNAFKFTCGTSDAFFVRAKFSIADVSGTDDCAVGFRKLEIYQANIDDYDEMACLNVISGAINIETIKNNGATTTTDTTDTWADAAIKTLQVNVGSNRAVTYLIDGVAPTTTAAFSFDSGEVLIPFFYFLHAADVAGAVVIEEFECGFQSAGGD